MIGNVQPMVRPPMPNSPVSDAMNLNEAAIENLWNKVQSLRERLQPICSAAKPVNATAMGMPDRNAMSQVVGGLHGFAQRIDSCTNELAELLELLEV